MGLKNSLEFQEYLLEHADVAVLSRNYFGRRISEENEEYVRFSYCISEKNIDDGMNRIEKLLL